MDLNRGVEDTIDVVISVEPVFVKRFITIIINIIALNFEVTRARKKAKDAAATKACFEHVKQCIQAHLDLNQRGLAICKKFKPDVHVPDHTVVQEAVETVKTKVVEAQSTVTARFHTILTDHFSFLRSI
ncbi:hypothetical protein AC1031_012572 [Aphanomyces cochlioides]|nr:hypothetical protein AC1031_012572 [Aphanomyces cochlioides]